MNGKLEKRILYVQPSTKDSSNPASIEKLDKMIQLDMDKKIAKERQSLAKTIAKYNEKPKKQEKLGSEIVEEATALLALLDQAKSQAIQSGNHELISHYDEIVVEIEGIREKYSL